MYTILAPIRYPLTGQSRQTLEFAAESASGKESAQLLVLHVDLLHRGGRVCATDIRRAIEPVVGARDTTVLVRRGFLLEDVIVDEVRHNDVDVIIVGKNRHPPWRRLISRVLGRDRAVASVLEQRTTNQIEVVG